jgi:transcriptional regulator with XRE-family HTH domain
MAVWAESDRDMGDTRVAFGAHIRALRIASGLSPMQLAAYMRAAGHGQWREQLIGNVQNGTRLVHTRELPALAAALNVSLEDLLLTQRFRRPPPDAIPEAWDAHADELVGLAKVFNAPPVDVLEVLAKHYGRDLDVGPKQATITVRVGKPNPDSRVGQRADQLKYVPADGDRERLRALVSATGAKSEAALVRRMMSDALDAYEAEYRAAEAS